MVIYPNFDRLMSFASVHHEIRAERLLLAAGMTVMALPTPREIDISCGQCLLFEAVDEDMLVKILQDHHVIWSKLFKRNIQDRVYEEIV